MKKLTLVPRGNVEKNYDFGTTTVEFDNGVQQVQRSWVSPRITFSMKVVGDKTMKEYLEDFFVSVGGNTEAFEWEYESKTWKCRFSDSSIKVTELRGYEGEGVVGYQADVGLTVLKDSEVGA